MWDVDAEARHHARSVAPGNREAVARRLGLELDVVGDEKLLEPLRRRLEL
jgi:hypothetical protein